ncbi:hypothetical protein ACHAWU_000543 [Discostella pseudostelligera]|uniref:Aminotransferase class I/classII large domain-containing protein n=1 Tax=Discostella pseudostelligera TaxID=259834 RepID=A0ABD3N847_9STRA
MTTTTTTPPNSAGAEPTTIADQEHEIQQHQQQHQHDHDDDAGRSRRRPAARQPTATAAAAAALAPLPLAGHRALILGGGPAGLSLALCLHQHGCVVQVHEKSSDELAVGVGGEQWSRRGGSSASCNHDDDGQQPLSTNTTTTTSSTKMMIFDDKGCFGYLLMPNGVATLDTLGIKQLCLSNARHLQSAEIYKRSTLVEQVNMDGIYCLARDDLLVGMINMLPDECVIWGSQVMEIEAHGEGETTVVIAVKVVEVSSGIETWLRLRPHHPHHHYHVNNEGEDYDNNHLDDNNNSNNTVFDYIFAADGVNSLLAKRLNPNMNRCPGGTTNTIVTCLKNEQLARKLHTRFIKTYFRSKMKQQCCAFGLLSPAEGQMLGFLQFSTGLHGQAPYHHHHHHAKKRDCRHAAELHRFIEDVLALPSSSSFASSPANNNSEISDDEPENICLLQSYLNALSNNEYDYHVWRFVPSGYVHTAHGINCAVLGDAAHPMSDFSSQGLSLAIEDAVSLGNHLMAHAAKVRDVEKLESVSSALANYDSERRSAVLQFIEAGDLIHGNFLSENDDEAVDLATTTTTTTTTGETVERAPTDDDGVDQPFIVHGGQVRRLSSLSTRRLSSLSIESSSLPRNGGSSAVRRRVSDFDPMDTSSDKSDVFLDPTLVDMKALSTVAYNYRWATLPDGVIPLTAASSDFPVCSAITNALKNHVDAGYFCYGPNEGLPQFRSTFATYFTEKLVRGLAYCNNELELEQQEDNKTTLYGASSIDPGQVMATNAAAAAVYAAAAATILEPGDEALVMSPVDFLLVDSVIALGGVVVRYSIKERLQDGDKNRPTFDLAEMESLVTPRTRMLSICNPHNPLGRSFSYLELSALVEFAERHKLCIVSDEVWCDVVHSPRVHLPTMCISQYAAAHTYTIFGFSKSHGLEGLRIGALIAPNEEKLAKVLMLSNTSTTANGASVAAQIAAVAAMTEAGSHESGWLASWRLHLHSCVLYTVTRLNAMDGVIANVPEATFVVWADVSSLLYPDNDCDDDGTHLVNGDALATVDIEPEFVLMQWLIHEHKVAIIPGLDRFFGPGSIGHIRISVATSKPILDTALDRLELGLKVWPTVRKRALHEAKVEAINAQSAEET